METIVVNVVGNDFSLPSLLAVVPNSRKQDGLNSVNLVDQVDQVESVDQVDPVNCDESCSHQFRVRIKTTSFTGGHILMARLPLTSSENVPHGHIGTAPKLINDFCHVHRAKTASSTRTLQFHDALHSHSTMPRSRNERRRKRRRTLRKEKKLQSIIAHDASPFPAISESFFSKSKSTFRNVVFDGQNRLGRRPIGSHWWNTCLPSSILHTVDCTEGYTLGSINRFVFSLLPRNVSLGNVPVTHTVQDESNSRKSKAAFAASTNAVVDALRFCCEHGGNVPRGGGKDVCCASPEAKVVRLGQYPFRGGPGIRCEDIPRGNAHVSKAISKFVRNLEHKMKEYLPTSLISNMNVARNVAGVQQTEIANHRWGDMYNSVYFGRDIYLSCHQDEDSFYGLISVQREVAEDSPYCSGDEPLYYFCFPTHGVKVALRAGDILLINPREWHCLSSPLRPGMEVYSLSLYLKTSIVGGNDNSSRT